MKIAYLVNQYPKTSHSFIRREIHALERLGCKVTRIALRGWDDASPDAGDQDERQRTHYLLKQGALPLVGALLRVIATRPRHFISAFKLAWQLSRKADRPWPFHFIYLAEACAALRPLQQAGVTHLHAHFGTNPAEVALLIHALGGPGYSYTIHGPEEFDKPEALHLATKVDHARFVVTVSSYGRSQLYRWVDPSAWPKVQVVHCGIDRTFQIDALQPPAGQALLCVGRLSSQKGHLSLIEAAALLLRRGVHFQLVLAGDGELRPAIEARIQALNLTQHVRITGWLTGEEVRRELLAARALVLASYAEGLPVVLMEAMAMRRPVIATQVAGIPELVRDGETGWLVPAADTHALADAMLSCLHSPPITLRHMGANARRRALERHNVDIEARKLHALFSAHAVPAPATAARPWGKQEAAA